MNSYLIKPYWGDEFNQYLSVPVTCDLHRKHFGKPEDKYYTFSLPQFIGLNNAADFIFTRASIKGIKNHFQVLGNADESLYQDLVESKFQKSDIENAINNYFIEKNIARVDIDTFSLFKPVTNQIGLPYHPYDYNYCNLSRNMQEGSYTQFLTTEELYNKWKTDKKTIVFNGRNYTGGRKGQEFRNTKFEQYISLALADGFRVINVTDLKPNLKFDTSDYIELDNNSLEYLEKVAIFQTASAVVSIGNAAGITVHLGSKANFMCYCLTDHFDDRWADNNYRYHHNGKSIVDARRELWPDVVTNFYHDPQLYKNDSSIKEHLKVISEFDKPIITEFFNTNKIIYI